MVVRNATFNLLPDDKISGLCKLKAFADNKSNITLNIKDRRHCDQHSLLFPQWFQKDFLKSVESHHCVVKV